VLILKWGGELTPAGKTQAEELGKAFRCMYPTYGETPGLGLLRLHSTYRHDLKVCDMNSSTTLLVSYLYSPSSVRSIQSVFH